MTASVTSLLVAAVVSERLRVTEALRQIQRELVKELDQRKKLERELQAAHSRATDILFVLLVSIRSLIYLAYQSRK